MKYYIIAGEASGDLHGANLMKALLEKDPQTTNPPFLGGRRHPHRAGGRYTSKALPRPRFYGLLGSDYEPAHYLAQYRFL